MQQHRSYIIGSILWFLALLFFILFINIGKIQENGEFLILKDFIPSLIDKSKRSGMLIIPAWLCSIIIAGIWNWIIPTSPPKHRWMHIFYKILEFIPIVFSALPTFVTGIFFIRLFQLDTVQNSNLFYAILCLSLFNFNYIYQRLRTKIANIYKETYILYAKSLGMPSKIIFKSYICPGILRDYLSVLRELLPHLIWESVVIEYVFCYPALIQSALDSLKYNSWIYFFLVIYILLLFITFFELFFRWLENALSPIERK
ncbi:MAG TPA: ABC transporter permease subunit [Planctomycetota bacterium]|nr:ABC transporter permease subunit [Planctomycetota bacterium]